MKLARIRKRTVTATTASLGIVGAAVTSVLTAPAAHATTVYWTFESLSYGTCLTAGTSGVAYATECNGSSYQQWDFIGTDQYYNQLKNRATGRCLATDNKTSTNAVWTSTCNWVDGQRFSINVPSQAFTDIWGKRLRAESDGSVFAGSELAYWNAWTRTN